MTQAPHVPAGTRFRAGLGASTVLPDCDFETYSEAGYFYDPERRRWHGPPNAAKGKAGLSVVGAANYAAHPSTEVLTFAYDLKDGHGPRVWLPGMANPSDLFERIAQGWPVEAWNSAFEWWIWNMVCTRRYGWPALAIEQTRCAMGKARAFALPGKLDLAAEVTRAATQKDKDGTRLLKKFSVPRSPTKANDRLRLTLADDPADAQKLIGYNVTDIGAEAAVSAQCPDLEGEELAFWIADQRINRRGVYVDRPALEDCAAIVRLCLERYNAELDQLTGGAVQAASQLARLRAFLATRGLHVAEGPGTMDEDAIDALLELPGLDPLARRALEIRQAVGSASVKKVFAMINTAAPWHRIHDLFNYNGARTGRPTGEGPQPTNLPKAGPPVWRCACGRFSGANRLGCAWCGALRPASVAPAQAKWTHQATDDVLAVIARRDLGLLEAVYGDALLCVSGVLRGMFTAAPGHVLLASDFSSIEGVVTACLAGEDWRVDMFATHGKAYELSVSKITGIAFSEIMAHAGFDDVESPEWWTRRSRKGEHHPLRQTIGKVAELASGFGGWIGAWKQFGADKPPISMGDDDIKAGILAWRAASPEIVEFWGGQERRQGYGRSTPELFGLEGMAVKAVLEPGVSQPVLRRDGTHTGVTYYCDGAILYCVLPSGRALYYHRPRLDANTRGFGGAYSLSFEGYNSNPKNGPTGWIRMSTYGGRLCENVVQATARDIQRHAMVTCEQRGLGIVLHVYDEIVVEVPEGSARVEDLEAIMCTMPAWATYRGKPWPIKAAGGWEGKRYRKDD